jgi:hypothetical protein
MMIFTNKKGLSDAFRNPLFTGDYLTLPKAAFQFNAWYSLPRFL